MICSTEEGLNKEIRFLKHVFTKINGYPSRIVNNTLFEVKRKIESESVTGNVVTVSSQSAELETVSAPYICLPYKGQEGEGILRKFKGMLSGILPADMKIRFIYKGVKLGSFFSVKDKVDIKHQTNLIYGYIPDESNGNRIDYVGQTNVRFGRRTREHAQWDKTSAVYLNAQERDVSVSEQDFVILEKGFDKYLDRRIAEALYVKEIKPVLNGQKMAFKLQLFN